MLLLISINDANSVATAQINSYLGVTLFSDSELVRNLSFMEMELTPCVCSQRKNKTPTLKINIQKHRVRAVSWPGITESPLITSSSVVVFQ